MSGLRVFVSWLAIFEASARVEISVWLPKWYLCFFHSPEAVIGHTTEYRGRPSLGKRNRQWRYEIVTFRNWLTCGFLGRAALDDRRLIPVALLTPRLTEYRCIQCHHHITSSSKNAHKNKPENIYYSHKRKIKRKTKHQTSVPPTKRNNPFLSEALSDQNETFSHQPRLHSSLPIAILSSYQCLQNICQ
jgi:hypothetical protein